VRTNVISSRIGEKIGKKRKTRIDEGISWRIGFSRGGGDRRAGLKKQIHTHTKEPAKTINLLILVTFFSVLFF
jgi:hypothetical protein